ncbi:CRISPR-associated endonuclease Cas2 [Mesomycoplasma moatsii]
MLMYDLPNSTSEENHYYSKFRSNIIKLGYIQLQQSIYVKIIQSKTLSNSHVEKIRKIIPPKGNIRIFIMTEYQFERGLILSGEINENEIINDDKRFRVI